MSTVNLYQYDCFPDCVPHRHAVINCLNFFCVYLIVCLYLPLTLQTYSMRHGRAYANLTQVCVCVCLSLFSFSLHFLTALKLYKCLFLFSCLTFVSVFQCHLHHITWSNSPHHLDPRGGWFFSLLTASCRPQSGSLFNQRPLLSIPFPLLCRPSSLLSGWMCCVRWLAWAWTNRDGSSLIISPN